MRPEDVIADKRRPYTGAEYIQSLRDGREVRPLDRPAV
jgi:4-hydroxyphenylacetate 3-monooxygenase